MKKFTRNRIGQQKLKNWIFLVKKTKSQKTDLKNGQNQKTKNPNTPLS